MKCNAVQYSDQMSCDCGNSWDMNDPHPPECRPLPNPSAVQGEPPRHPATPLFFEYPSFEESADFDPPPAQQSAPCAEALEPIINKSTGEGAMNKPKTRPRNLRSLMREGSADFGPVPAQQPAPDVKALVEALTELCDEIDRHDIHSAISKTNILWFKRKARAAVAPYRKGGEA